MKTYPNLAVKLCISLSLVLLTLAHPSPSLPAIAAPSIIRVPLDYSTIQAAVNAAQSGDVILVSPGTYHENIAIAGKTITLASLYYETQDSQYIETTIIDAGGKTGISVDNSVGPETTIMGFTIRNGLVDGIATDASLNILYNHFDGNDDNIDFYGGGGVVRGNIFENGTDDGIDLDDDVNILIEDNIIRNNHQDGIEIRLEEYSGPEVKYIIRNNQLIGNGHDGIQLVDYPDVSSRVFLIERNLFLNNQRVGLGMMDNAESVEDYRAASIPERVYLFNNTFVGNNYAITGGDNLVAVNNIIINSLTQGIKNADGNSIVAYTLFWNNWTDQAGSNLDLSTTQIANPLLDASNNLNYDSPAIDAGVAEFIWQGQTVLNIPATDYFDAAPDLGWHESNFSGQPSPTASWTSTITPTLPPSANPTYILLDDASIYSSYPTSNYGSAASLEVDNSPIKHFLLKFSLSGVNGRVVTKATLRLYSVGSSNKGGDFYYIASNDWDERTVTWNTAPPSESDIIYSLGSVNGSRWYDVDLTSIVNGDGIYSFRIRSTSTDGADYSSKESVNPPQLVITVADPPGGTWTPTATPVYSHTPTEIFTPSPTPSPTATLPPINPSGVRFAVLGDYGAVEDSDTLSVAILIKSWNVDFIVTHGDNTNCSSTQWDACVGSYYHEFIYPYTGTYGPGAAENRFWPALGNHDWDADINEWYSFFTLPNNERYYSIPRGPVRIIILSSDGREPDGNTLSSWQGQWFLNAAAKASEPWKLVFFHHAPYSSAYHGSTLTMRWGFENYGVDAVFSGHDHVYERFNINGIPYFVNGLGGSSIYNFGAPIAGSQVRYNGDYGAMLVDADNCQITYRFFNRSSVQIDSYSQTKPDCAPPTDTPVPTNTPWPLPTNTPTLISSPSPLPSDSPAPTVTPSPLPTSSPTLIPTPSPLPSNSPTLTGTPVPTDTATSVPVPSTPPPPTSTSTESVSPTPLPTATYTITPIPSSSATASDSPTPLPTQSLQPLYISLQNAGPTTVGTLTGVTNNDIIRFDGIAWSMFFDASDVGLTVPVSAFAVIDANTILLSLGKAANIAPIGKVDVQDILRFTGILGPDTSGKFSLYFDGSDVGLDKAQESITVLHSLPDGSLIIGTKGTSSVPGMNAASEDLMLFTPISLGENTAGSWSLFIDGSDVALTVQARIDAIAVGPTGDLYLSTLGAFNLGVIAGENEDVFICTNPQTGATTICTFLPDLYFDGSQWGLAGDNVDSIGLP